MAPGVFLTSMVFVPRPHEARLPATGAAWAAQAFDVALVPREGLSARTSPSLLPVEREGRLYLLKQLPWYVRDPQHVLFNVEMQAALHRSGLPLPALLRTADGRLSIRHDDPVAGVVSYIVQEFVVGRPFHGDLQQVRTAGRLCASFSVNAQRCMVQPPTGTPLVETALQTGSAVSAYCQHHTTNARVGRLLDRIGLLIGSSACGDERRLVHGDFNSTNLLFSPNGAQATLLDFDDLAIGLPFEDLSRGLLFFAGLRLRDGCLGRWPDRLHRPAAEAFLQGYASIEPPDIDAAHRALLGVAAHVFGLGVLDGAWSEADIARAEGFFEACAERDLIEDV
jgi:Ser/Thr protein kinase RdoA (MazF antagonist)